MYDMALVVEQGMVLSTVPLAVENHSFFFIAKQSWLARKTNKDC